MQPVTKYEIGTAGNTKTSPLALPFSLLLLLFLALLLWYSGVYTTGMYQVPGTIQQAEGRSAGRSNALEVPPVTRAGCLWRLLRHHKKMLLRSIYFYFEVYDISASYFFILFSGEFTEVSRVTYAGGFSHTW